MVQTLRILQFGSENAKNVKKYILQPKCFQNWPFFHLHLLILIGNHKVLINMFKFSLSFGKKHVILIVNVILRMR